MFHYDIDPGNRIQFAHKDAKIFWVCRSKCHKNESEISRKSVVTGAHKANQNLTIYRKFFHPAPLQFQWYTPSKWPRKPPAPRTLSFFPFPRSLSRVIYSEHPAGMPFSSEKIKKNRASFLEQLTHIRFYHEKKKYENNQPIKRPKSLVIWTEL